jgi:hypothetical protein
MSIPVLIAAFCVSSLSAQAADVTVGGGADAIVGALVQGGGVVAAGGLREVEGNARLQAGAVRARLDVDLGLDFGGGALVGGVQIEHATVGVDAGTASLDAGVAVSPWRVESVDPWERAFATEWGGAARAPGQILGATLGFGRPDAGVALVGGLGIGSATGGSGVWTAGMYGDGAELDAVGGFAGVAGAPLVLGAHGRLAQSSAPDATRLTGGAWIPVRSPGAGGVEVGGRWVGEPVALQAEGLVTFDGGARAVAQVEVFPGDKVRPSLRGGWDGGPLGALVVGVAPVEWLIVRAEAGYARGTPSGWLDVAAFVPVKKGGKGKKR